MHLYLDSADLADLERALPDPLVYGVTTNPTLMKRAGLAWDDLPGFLRRVASLGARAVHVQVRHRDVAGMLADARVTQALARTSGVATTIVTKLPATREGLAAAAPVEGGVSTTSALSEMPTSRPLSHRCPNNAAAEPKGHSGRSRWPRL